jgi:hypothetical protein
VQLVFASELAALSAVARPRIPFLILNCALLNFNHLKSDIVVTFTNRVGAASEARIVLRQWITLTTLTICGAALAQFKFNECRQLFIRAHNEALSSPRRTSDDPNCSRSEKREKLGLTDHHSLISYHSLGSGFPRRSLGEGGRLAQW